MSKFEARPLPADTREVTYTGKGGRQVTVRISQGKRGPIAHPETPDDVRALDALFPAGDDETTTTPADAEQDNQDDQAPAAGEQEG